MDLTQENYNYLNKRREMTEQIGEAEPAATFEYELYEGDSDRLVTVVATPNLMGSWIDPAALKLKHRIGRGPFGDVWLATHHRFADDHDEYHEVAVKILHPLKEDGSKKMLGKVEELFLKIQGLRGVCWLHGVSILNEKVCIVMKFYEGSIADRMARIKGGKLLLSDALRYGTDLARGILELHHLGLLVLNLKPSNFLLNESNQAILGDFGLPFLLLGTLLANPDMALRCGTPNYMAPEQWEPDVRGPLSFETDSWGLGCSILEMLTGAQPWFGKSIAEIYNLVVIKQQRPRIPSGLPPAIENVLNGCFENDLRNRPLIEDILHAFESSQSVGQNDGEWCDTGNRAAIEKPSFTDYTTWYLSKDHIHIGDMVRSRKPTYACKTKTVDIPLGTVISLESGSHKDSFVTVKIHGVLNHLKVKLSSVETVTHGFAAGDWVQLIENGDKHSSVGLLHSIQRDGRVEVGFMGLETLWRGQSSQLQLHGDYCIGQFVRIRSNVISPRFKWIRKKEGSWATGRIVQVLSNGGLAVTFPGRLFSGKESSSFLADPAEVELVSFDTCSGLLQKYEHIEDFHWIVRPLAVTFGLLTTLKLGLEAGRLVGTKLKKCKRSRDGNSRDSHGSVSTGWLPTPVANILFKDGGQSATQTR